MPRDDLSIDFVKRMAPGEVLDPGVILEDWINRVQNLPEEIRFAHEEIADKDRQYNECLRIIEDRDAKIQRWIKTYGAHEINPKEDTFRAQIRESFVRADQLSQEKMNLTQKLMHQFDKHIRALDVQVKQLYDRNEPGFNNPDETPSLLRPSAANHSAPLTRLANPASSLILGGPAIAAANTAPSIASPATARLPGHAAVRNAQTQQQQLQQHAASAPTTPAASIIMNSQQRESSAGPSTKRGARTTAAALGTAPTQSSNLARHSSIGPGTPKGGAGPGTGSVSRAGSVGPRTGSVKAGGGNGSRRGTPTAAASNSRKKPPKSSLSRVKKISSRNSVASADSDLSDAVSGSELDDTERRRSRGTPLLGGGERERGDRGDRNRKDADGDEVLRDADEDDDEDEGSDDKKYCLCHNISYGDMVACDNEICPYEWFHWSCVGLKSEPNGTWYCPECTQKLKAK